MSTESSPASHLQEDKSNKIDAPATVVKPETPRPALFPANTVKTSKFLIPAFDVSDRTVPGTPRGGSVIGTMRRPASMSSLTKKHPALQSPHHRYHKHPSFSGVPSTPPVKLPSQLALESCWTGLEVPPSNGDFHYMDYTHQDCEGVQFSDERVKERMIANRGKDHLMIRWCAYCEELACHRHRAWEILQAILGAFPQLDYTHALPSQRPELHNKELLHPSKHQTSQQLTCSEMYIFFHPRGQPLKSLLASDGATAVAALQECIGNIPNRNVTVTLISARNLPSAGLLAKTNPFVRFKAPGQELVSTYCPETQNPDFHLQCFTFHIAHPSQSIEVEVCNAGKKEKQLATATISVNDLVIGKNKQQSIPLAPAGVITVVLAADGAPFVAAPVAGTVSSAELA